MIAGGEARNRAEGENCGGSLDAPLLGSISSLHRHKFEETCTCTRTSLPKRLGRHRISTAILTRRGVRETGYVPEPSTYLPREQTETKGVAGPGLAYGCASCI